MPEENNYTTLRDSLDFRDKIYQPALIALDREYIPDVNHIHIRNQGQEGTCTGFGLAAVIDYLNGRRGIADKVSARMLYEMAKRYDRWPGDDYEGSSIRAAMKGWSKHGVCHENTWKYETNRKSYLSQERQDEALKNPLGAYYRVLPRRSDVHTALLETGALYVSATVHKGWRSARHKISYKPSWLKQDTYGHAFAIIGYTEEGFLVQNSWGENWGGYKHNDTMLKGVSIWSYEDFEQNVWDIWVARMALPVESLASLQGMRFTDQAGSSKRVEKSPPQSEIRNSYVHIDDGKFDPEGDYPSGKHEVQDIIDRATGKAENGDPVFRHIVLYAHGGLNSVKGSAMRVARWQPVFEANGVCCIHFLWETGMMEELRDILLGKNEFAQQRAGGISDWWDRWIEKLTRPLGGALWKEMQADAGRAFETANDGSWFMKQLEQGLGQYSEQKRPRLHLVGHSAGSILFANLLQRWMKQDGHSIDNLVLFAPACTHDVFHNMIKPAVAGRYVKQLHHLLLDNRTERDDNVAAIYRKSLLYLVSRSFQKKGHIVPVMGMAKYLHELDVSGLGNKYKHYITKTDVNITRSQSHGGFDNDIYSMNSMLKFVIGKKPSRAFTTADMEDY